MPEHPLQPTSCRSPQTLLDRLANDHEVHLWYVRPEDPALDGRLAAYRALLSETEGERNARFVFEKGRRDDLITRALVRTTLSRYHPAVDPLAWQFAPGPFGRPELVGPGSSPAVSFNLSHTDGLIVCLVAADREIGVDVEDAARIGPHGVAIADRYFSPAEVADLRAHPTALQPSRFYDYWTLKEAYIKARGMGLALPLDQFSFHLGASEPIGISFGPEIDDDPDSWQFDLRSLTPRHRLAIAIRRRQEPDLTVRIWPAVPLAE